MKESQNVEWKESWRDEYLRWICGFANAEGGLLVIGKNDKGVVVGLPNAKKLLEDLPNKIRDILGIMTEVNLREEDGKDYLEIRVEPYPSPISYKGEYHYRSGSTKQELKGTALEHFLLKKRGRHWDDAPEPSFTAKSCSAAALRLFKQRAKESGRMDRAVLRDSREVILGNLELVEKHGLKRAACLLFSDRPEQYVSGAWIKIGFFVTDAIQQKLLSLLQAKPDISQKELATALGVTRDGIKYHLNKMKLDGLIRHVGPTRGGQWEVLQETLPPT